MIRIGFDQFTLILRPTIDFEIDEWEDIALFMISEFIEKASIQYIFSEIAEMKIGLPQGYTQGLTCPKEPFYFSMAYHEFFSKMGVIIKFSGNAWAIYQSQYKELSGEDIYLYKFLQKAHSPFYEMRLSRVDPYVDFIDEGVEVSQIKKSLESGRLVLRYGKY